MNYQCPICGYPSLTEPPRSARSGGGSYEICRSCGFEFGVTDDDLGFSYGEWRRLWVEAGMPWRSTQPMPTGWAPARQLATLPRNEH
jgi:hypothetical protein